MLKHQRHQSIVYNADGVEFTIYATTKPTKSAPRVYRVFEERLTTGKRRLLNNKTLKAAKERANKIRAAPLKGQANRCDQTCNGPDQDHATEPLSANGSVCQCQPAKCGQGGQCDEYCKAPHRPPAEKLNEQAPNQRGGKSEHGQPVRR